MQGSLRERASDWLDRAGDLYAVVRPDEPHQRARPEPDAGAPAHRAPGPVNTLSATRRADVRPGQRVAIVLKADQVSGRLTEGTVRDLLTNSPTHPRGIKVRLESGEIGRVKIVY
ncbi:MAG: YwbE family protein [Polyangiaceae bacterium]|nr:YwbE family protein [Polyangiaceae bacterium]